MTTQYMSDLELTTTNYDDEVMMIIDMSITD